MQCKFGERVRALREQHNWTQRQLAHAMGVSVSYISKVERDRLHFGDYPSEEFILNLAAQFGADEDELLILADNVPEGVRRRIRERPDVFRGIAELDDAGLDRFAEAITCSDD